jgi:hypothetical protein
MVWQVPGAPGSPCTQHISPPPQSPSLVQSQPGPMHPGDWLATQVPVTSLVPVQTSPASQGSYKGQLARHPGSRYSRQSQPSPVQLGDWLVQVPPMQTLVPQHQASSAQLLPA